MNNAGRIVMEREAKLHRLDEALAELEAHEHGCRLCPRQCGVDRGRGERGFCRGGTQAVVSHALRHFGEEPVLSGTHDCVEADQNPLQNGGSGTIFFSGCNLKCLFCQNYQISWLDHGHLVTEDELAEEMLRLQRQGALNINLVSSTPWILPILRALRSAYAQGLSLPLVYNSNGYEKAEVIRACRDIFDIFLPDLKYFSACISTRYSAAPDYFLHAQAAIREMQRQQPCLVLDEKEVAKQGLIVRHLALPGMTEDSTAILDWLDRHCLPTAALSLMSQYHPCFKAPPELRRPLSSEEYRPLVARAKTMSCETLFIQTELFGTAEHRIPDFDRKNPFDWT